MDNKLYPMLNMLGTHGLEAAYFILIIGSKSWPHFLGLHRRLPETCKLPEEILVRLRGEHRSLVGEEVRCTGPLADGELLDAFNDARGKHDLQALYWDRLMAVLEPMGVERERLEIGDEWAQLAFDPGSVFTEKNAEFAGTWIQWPAEIEVFMHEDKLIVRVSLKPDLTETIANEIGDAASKASIRPVWSEVFCGKLEFGFELQGASTIVDSDGRSRQFFLNGLRYGHLGTQGLAKLADIAATVGITNLACKGSSI